jgi:hypothetical protein
MKAVCLLMMAPPLSDSEAEPATIYTPEILTALLLLHCLLLSPLPVLQMDNLFNMIYPWWKIRISSNPGVVGEEQAAFISPVYLKQIGLDQ